MSDDPIDRLLAAERASALSVVRELLHKHAEATEKTADFAITADKRAMIACDERDAAYLRVDDLANEVQTLRNERAALVLEVKTLRLRLAQYETATQPPADA